MGVSRQYKWQLKQHAKGKCTICGKQTVTSWHCETHARMTATRNREKAREKKGSKKHYRSKYQQIIPV